MTHQETTRAIYQEVQAVCKNYRHSHPFLKNQDAIGFGVMVFCFLMIIPAIVGYFYWNFPAIFVMLWIAFWTSFLHELEHDLIHYLYFKKNPFMHHLMMLGVWIFRPMTVSPWLRRHLHLHHHKYSGLDSDLEERGVTNGMKWGLLRAIVLPDQILSFLVRAPKMYPEIRQMEKQGKFTQTEVRNLWNIVFFGFLPVGLPLYFLWYGFVLGYIAMGLQTISPIEFTLPDILPAFLHFSQPFVVILIAPNLFRQYCLHFITSHLHYYGDVEQGNFLQQTQIFYPWWSIPMQIFCFNFGYTHAIHHFVVQETFYIRQLTAKPALEILKKYGIRFNDMGTFTRNNRYFET